MHACKDHLHSFIKHIIVAVSNSCTNCLRNILSCIASVVIAHVSTCKRAPTLSLQYAWLCPWLEILCRCTREDMLICFKVNTSSCHCPLSFPSKLHILQEYTSAYIQSWPPKTHALYISKADKCMRYYVHYCRISQIRDPAIIKLDSQLK